MGVRSVEELVSYADASGKAELDMKEVVLNQTNLKTEVHFRELDYELWSVVGDRWYPIRWHEQKSTSGS